MYIYIYINIHTYICVYIYIYTYICVCVYGGVNLNPATGTGGDYVDQDDAAPPWAEFSVIDFRRPINFSPSALVYKYSLK